MSPKDCSDCGADDRLHDEIGEALGDSALEPAARRQLAAEARRRATATAVPERIEAMPKRRETLLVLGLAAALLLIVGGGLLFMKGDGDVDAPGDRPDEIQVVRGHGEELLVPLAQDPLGRIEAVLAPPLAHEFDRVLVNKMPEALVKDPLPTRSSGPIGVLAGQVRASDGRRLEGARVQLVFDTYRSGEAKLPEGEEISRFALTDHDGEFRFESVPVGQWRLTAKSVGHASRQVTGLAVTDRAGIEGVGVVLVGDGDEVGAIEGTVTDADGNPLPNALITLNGTFGGSSHTTRTDEEGKYRVDRLLPGGYGVRCAESAGSSGAEYFLQAKQTKFTNVVPGKVTRVDFTGSGTLSGVVLDAQGNPLANVIVRIAPIDEKGNFRDGRYQPVQVRTDEEGRFRMLNAGTGPQSVSVQSTESGNAFSIRLADIELIRGDEDVTLQLESSGIEGRVTLAETGEPPNFRVYVAMYRVKPWGHAATAGLDADGNYRFRSVVAGAYRIFVTYRGYGRLVRDIEFKSGEFRTDVDFSMEKLVPGTIVLTVKDPAGKPVEGIMISYQTEASTWSSLMVDRGEPGVYTCRQLETGTYKVNVWRRDLMTKQVEVKVVSGETTKVEVVLTPRPVK